METRKVGQEVQSFTGITGFTYFYFYFTPLHACRLSGEEAG